MAKEINIQKILSELDKGTPDEQYDALVAIKNHVTKNMMEVQKKKEDEASDLQSKIEKIKNNNH